MILKKIIPASIFILLFLLLLSGIVTAQDKPNTFISLKDVNTQKPVDNILISLELDSVKSIQYVPANESLKLYLSEGQHNITLIVDNILTEGKDYYKKAIIDSSTSNLGLFQVGSVQGIVKDDLDNIIPGADLKCECGTNINGKFQIKTDKFGSFNSIVPVGKCKIFATYNDKMGYTIIDISKGESKDIEIILDKKISSSFSFIYYFIIAIIILVAIFMIILKSNISLFKKKEKELERKESSNEIQIKELSTELKLGKRAQDVFETLTDKEKEIIEFILESKGKTSQAKIYHETGIPKTSLFRYIQSLTMKNIIEVKKIGKVKKIKFSAWFLEKDSKNKQ